VSLGILTLCFALLFWLQQLRQLGDVGGDAPGLIAGELGPRQRLAAHGEKMLACKAEQRLIMDRVAALRLPAIYQWPENAAEGGFAAYGPSVREIALELARQLAKVSFALLIGIAASPVTACELEQKAASHRTVTAFLTEHGRAATSTPLPQLVACKADGSACAADAECCSGACKPIGEGRACVAK
jgi:hypothetical protein